MQFREYQCQKARYGSEVCIVISTLSGVSGEIWEDADFKEILSASSTGVRFQGNQRGGQYI